MKTETKFSSSAFRRAADGPPRLLVLPARFRGELTMLDGRGGEGAPAGGGYGGEPADSGYSSPSSGGGGRAPAPAGGDLDDEIPF